MGLNKDFNTIEVVIVGTEDTERVHCSACAALHGILHWGAGAVELIKSGVHWWREREWRRGRQGASLGGQGAGSVGAGLSAV